MTNEKDKDIAGGIIYQINKERRGHLMGDCAGEKCHDWITRQSEIISKVLATVRAEERKAALEDARKAVSGLFHNSEVNHSRWNTAITKAINAIEATEK